MELAVAAASIFALRIADVALGTLRIGFLVRGRPWIAGALGFAESLVWLLAAAQVLTNLDAPLHFVAYAAGYAAGTVVGVQVERWVAVGDMLMRIVAPVDTISSARALRDAGFVVTEMNAEGRNGQVRVAFSVLPRRKVRKALRIVQSVNPDAFVTFEGTTPTRMTPFPPERPRK